MLQFLVHILLATSCLGQITRNQLPSEFLEFFEKIPVPAQELLLNYLPLPDAPMVPVKRGKFKSALSMDGGGPRGLIGTVQLIVLAHTVKEIMLEDPEFYGLPSGVTKTNQFQIDATSLWDSYSGVSAGSYMALVLATDGAHVEKLIPVVKKLGLKGNDPLSTLMMWIRLIRIAASVPIDGSNKEAYIKSGKIADAAIELALIEMFGDLKLSEVNKTVYIGASSFDLSNAVGFFGDVENGKNGIMIPNSERHVKEIFDDKDFLLWKIARVSSAQPIMFLPYEIQEVKGKESWILFDGVFTHNNPVGGHLAYLVKRGDKLEDLVALSLGTTRCGPKVKSVEDYFEMIPNFLFAWGTPAANSNVQGVFVQEVLGDRYFRINRNYDRKVIEEIKDEEEREEARVKCQAANDARNPGALIEIGIDLAREYGGEMREWVSRYLLATEGRLSEAKTSGGSGGREEL